MKLFLVITSAAVLYGCNNSSDKGSNENSKSTANTVSSIEFMQPRKISVNELPEKIKSYGSISEAWEWLDSLGENLFILTQDIKKDNTKNEDGEGLTIGSIRSIHFIKNEGVYRNKLSSDDGSISCSFDLVNEYIPGSTTITDLDNDGFAEIKTQYTSACRSDVSPADMTLKLRENEKSYLLWGKRWIAISPEMKFDITENNVSLQGAMKEKDEMKELVRTMGKFNTEYQFSDAPPTFLVYAKAEWIKYAKETKAE